MTNKPVLENIFKDFKSFRSSPITYVFFILFAALISIAYNSYTKMSNKLDDCEDNERVLNQKFQDIVFKEKEHKNLDSTNHKIN
jgi:hypothetical protein